ncbi:MAG: T9SS type A sorting domain-containing protein [Ignavibacteria bacterium]|nr:T9SS type A sorting domain-containing protein [Ignavibacteria bacterium]
MIFLCIAAYLNTLQAQPYNKWKIFNRDNSPLPSNKISAIAEDKNGTYWIGCASEFLRDTTYQGGIIKFDGSSWLIFDSSNSPLKRKGISDIAVDKNNKIVISTYDAVFLFDGLQWKKYSSDNSPLPSNPSQGVITITIDHQNNYWFGIYNYGIIRLADTSWTFYNDFSAFDGIGDFDFIKFDSLHNLWVGTSLFGLWCYNGMSWKKIMPGYIPGIISNGYTSLMVDRNLQVWLTYNNFNRWGVIATLVDTTWQEYDSLNFGFRPLLSFDTAVADSLNRKFFGSDIGLIMYNDTTWTIFNSSNSPIPAGSFTRGINDSKNNKIYGISNFSPSFRADHGLIFYNENGVVLSSIEEPNSNPPSEFKLFQNYPNPFNSRTIISYQLATASPVTLKVFDLLGREIAILVNEPKSAGRYEIEFGADKYGLSSGTYFYQITSGLFSSTKKFILLK